MRTKLTVNNKLIKEMVNIKGFIEDYQNDVWDCSEIPENRANSRHKLDFTNIPIVYREVVKRYIKTQLQIVSCSILRENIKAVGLFLKYIHSQEPTWTDLELLTQKHIEEYLSWGDSVSTKTKHHRHLLFLCKFLENTISSKYPEAPKTPSDSLLFQIKLYIKENGTVFKEIPQKEDWEIRERQFKEEKKQKLLRQI